MARVFILISFILTAFSKKSVNSPILDQDKAYEVFTLINKVRSNPSEYFQKFKLNSKLKINNENLVWNDLLAQAAEDKALDMAERNYFGHIDPDGYGMNYYINDYGYSLSREFLNSNRANHFESICAGEAGPYETVKALIIDNGIANKGHRNHLLGIGAHYNSLVDIGVGYVDAKNAHTKYQSYVCILIAKH